MKIEEFKGIANAIRINVYRWTLGDCTNNGISNRNNELLIIGEINSITKEFKTFDDNLGLPNKINFNNEEELKVDNLCLLIRRNLFGENADYIVGLKDYLSGVWTMMGGNFGYSCDSRYAEIINKLPLPIHDRIED